MSRIRRIALGVMVALSQQPGVTRAAADQPVTVADVSASTRTAPVEPATAGAPMLKDGAALSNARPLHQQPRSTLTMDRRLAADTHGSTPSAAREEDAVFWQHALPTAIPLSGALVLRDLDSAFAGLPPTPTARQALEEDDLAIVAGLQLRF